MDQYLTPIISRFMLDAPVASCKRFGNGHINDTYLVTAESGKRYVLQRINNHVFKDVAALMENVSSITNYLLHQNSDDRSVLHPVCTTASAAYIKHTDGTYWRMYNFIEGSICLDAPETPEDFYQSAVAFGNFQQQLKDFPAATLHETIPNFHNTQDRYRIFQQVLASDPCGRAKNVQEEIAFALAHEGESALLVEQQRDGLLPLRVTHNDTKLNNVMLDAVTRKPLCVVDLDTVMPGLSLYDFGDAIRFGAATAPEDETDLSKVEMNLELFRIFTRGFLSACPSLTDRET